MKILWSPDLFYKAFNFAANAHNSQKIPGSDLPYITHIACVCAELMVIIDDNINGDLIVQCGALHDTIEDTQTTLEELKQEFGQDVASGVSSLSKNRKIKKTLQVEESISRILQQPKEIWMVKMADRITNLNPPPKFWTSEKRKLYYEQSLVLHDTFKEASSLLAERLITKIEQYKYYL